MTRRRGRRCLARRSRVRYPSSSRRARVDGSTSSVRSGPPAPVSWPMGPRYFLSGDTHEYALGCLFSTPPRTAGCPSPRHWSSRPQNSRRRRRVRGSRLRSRVSTPTPTGPPYPDPIDGVAVYDYAGILEPGTITSLTSAIGAIEGRTGVEEIVVYTQVKPASDTDAKAESDAAALIDQWPSDTTAPTMGWCRCPLICPAESCHRKVQFYAGPGYQAAYLTDPERQRIYEQDMLPLLRECDIDAAVLAAMARIDATATSGASASTPSGSFRSIPRPCATTGMTSPAPRASTRTTAPWPTSIGSSPRRTSAASG